MVRTGVATNLIVQLSRYVNLIPRTKKNIDSVRSSQNPWSDPRSRAIICHFPRREDVYKVHLPPKRLKGTMTSCWSFTTTSFYALPFW